MQPLLTIGVPTLGARPDRLAKAIGSALAQTRPAKVLIADQNEPGDDGPAVRAAKPYHGHPLVRHVHTGAKSLRDNWLSAMDNADTPYFCWLQDDDIISPNLALRSLTALESRPQCPSWMAYLSISTFEGLGNRWQFTGPMIPMDLLHGGCKVMSRELAIVGGYFTSHCLSPALVFRATEPIRSAIRAELPERCDLFAERIVPATLTRFGPPVCDPLVAGYWVQHDGNESKNQHPDADRQYRAMLPVLDARLPALGTDWRPALIEWAALAGAAPVQQWLEATEPFDGDSPILAEARGLLRGLITPAEPEPQPEPQPEPEPEPEPEAKPARSRRRARKGA